MLPNSNKILCLINDVDRHVYIHQSTIESFMEKNPPCETCLIQGMCIKQDKDEIHNFIRIEICDKFKEFICNYELGNNKT